VKLPLKRIPAKLSLYLVLLCFTPCTYAANSFVNLFDSGPGTLREAILFANASSGTHEVQFTDAGVLQLTTPLPPLTGNLAVTGAAQGTSIAAPLGTNIFLIATNGSLRLGKVTLTDGQARDGGAIRNHGTLHADDCRFLNNVATGGNIYLDDNSASGGAAIWNSGQLRLERILFSSNLLQDPPRMGEPSLIRTVLFGSKIALLLTI
jgi:hypothetical protein